MQNTCLECVCKVTNKVLLKIVINGKWPHALPAIFACTPNDMKRFA